MKNPLIWCLVILAMVLTGCSAGGDRQKADQLLVLAQEETRSITVPRDRLQRLLNIAEIQIRFGQPVNARKSLVDAAGTLRSPEAGEIDMRIRLAGWVSVSELSRRAGDKGPANKATDEAVALLNRIEPLTNRPPYVRAIAAEIRELRGAEAASRLLVSGARWAASIVNRTNRRLALFAFANDAFTWEEYGAGRDVLRCETDPSWRVDTLTRMAEDARGGELIAVLFDGGERTPFRKSTYSYGRSLSYEENFVRQK